MCSTFKPYNVFGGIPNSIASKKSVAHTYMKCMQVAYFSRTYVLHVPPYTELYFRGGDMSPLCTEIRFVYIWNGFIVIDYGREGHELQHWVYNMNRKGAQIKAVFKFLGSQLKESHVFPRKFSYSCSHQW